LYEICKTHSAAIMFGPFVLYDVIMLIPVEKYRSALLGTFLANKLSMYVQ